ncbi:hypothetical protein E2C01_079096 [Portunus trituberculatus]|uniref:Uncharacterized protein n=1 Tax=Portunus trituberculatus TaxID=210409 RepID=A0A5B7IUN7_PORTR|nr:hypothetical protein [Portunus trituberculatus]
MLHYTTLRVSLDQMRNFLTCKWNRKRSFLSPS